MRMSEVGLCLFLRRLSQVKGTLRSDGPVRLLIQFCPDLRSQREPAPGRMLVPQRLSSIQS